MLSPLFKTEKRIKILETALKRNKITVKDISRDTGVSKGLVSRYLDYMRKEGLLNRSGQSYHLQDQVLTRALKILLNLEKLNWNEITPKWAISTGLYGSWASGTNKEESDLDIWIKVEQYPSEDELNHLYKNLKSRTASEVNMLILTFQKLDSIKKTDPPFYNSLQRNSLILEGEPF
jgi:predicted nucleotidyltransferase